MTEHVSADLERAARIMDEATSGFTLEPYALEALEALVAAGWTITPPTTPPRADRPGPGYALLNRLGDALVPARAVRYEPDESFAEVATVDLDTAARNLRALGYSCTEGARKLERLRALRPS